MNERLQRNIKLLYIFSFLRFFAFWQPIEQLFLFSIGASTAVLGIGTALWTLSQFAFEIPSGYISDKFGKKNVFYIAQASRIAGFLVIAIPRKVSTYYLGLILFGAAMAFISGSDKALLHDSLVDLKREKEYKRISGIMNGLSGIGVMAAGILAVFIARFGYSYNYSLSIIPQLLVLLVIFMMFEPKHYTKELLKNPARDMMTAIKSITTVKALQLLVLLAGTMELVKRINMDFGQAFLFSVIGAVTLVPAIWVIGTGSRALSNFIAHKVESHTWGLVAATFLIFIVMSFSSRIIAPILYILVFLPVNIVILQAEEAVQKVAPAHLRATTLSGMNMLINIVQTLPIIALGWFMADRNPILGFQISSITICIAVAFVYLITLTGRKKIKTEVL
ncbi:MAG TPA: MFS transporter [Candidatus Saccharimonadales bacterium]|nr:MFS transporter [Candidatus Saccharimonadales bacterium]